MTDTDRISHVARTLEFLEVADPVASYCGAMSSGCGTAARFLQTRLDRRGKSPWQINRGPWHIPLDELGGCRPADTKELVLGMRLDGHWDDDGQHLDLHAYPASVVVRRSAGREPSESGPCCFEHHDSVVVRRFHFDLNRKEPPQSHLQIGGRAKWASSVGHYCMPRKMDEPRLPHPPYDLAIVLHVLISSFSTPLGKLTKDGKWRKLVRRSEDVMLGTYYRNVADWLDGRAGSTCLNDGLKPTDTLYEFLCHKPRWEA